MTIVRLFILMIALVCNSHQAFAVSDEQLKSFTELPTPKLCRLIPFKDAYIKPGDVSGTYNLYVTGPASLIMDIKLIPYFYVDQPEYWGIEVVGCLKGINLVSPPPYLVSMPVQNMGSKGVEVIGATGSSKKIDYP